MLMNFFKVAIRNLWRKKLFSAINIIGLSVGMTCFFLIAVHVKDEFSYDNFHKDGDNLYRVALERIYPDNVVFYAIIPHGISAAMLTDFPEVEQMTRLLRGAAQSVVFRYEDTRFEEDKVFFADSNVFETFGLTLLEGDPDQRDRYPQGTWIERRQDRGVDVQGFRQTGWYCLYFFSPPGLLRHGQMAAEFFL